MLFFELLQIAIGNRKMLSHAPTEEEWNDLFALSQKQAMVGIAFRGVEQLPKEQRPTKQLLMQWYMVTERIKAMNADLDRKALAVANKFLDEGFPGVVLKGQGIAKLYQLCNYEDEDENDNEDDNENCHPDGGSKHSTLNTQQVERSSISNYRTPGDIDIWLYGEREAVLDYVRQHVPDCKPVYHHVDFPVVNGLDIEVHFTPSWMNSPLRNRCLQRFFKSMVNSQQSTEDGPHPSPLQKRGDSGHPGCSQISHTELTEDTEFSCNAENICQRELDTNSQNLQVASLACGLRDEGFGLTQTLHDAAPVPSGVIACSDHELHGLHEYSGASATKNISHGCSRIDTDSRIASLACGHPDGTVDRRPLTVDTCLDSKQATLPVPNTAFNRVYILVHIYRHLFAEGIGLRQLLDYYFVLSQGFTGEERAETLRTLRSLGMLRFTRAVMWVLQEVYGMDSRYLLTTPDGEEGRFLLNEIMMAGNFGQYDERMQHAAGEGAFRWGLRKVKRNFRFVWSYPSEVLWSPIFKLWHYFWRMRRRG